MKMETMHTIVRVIQLRTGPIEHDKARRLALADGTCKETGVCMNRTRQVNEITDHSVSGLKMLVLVYIAHGYILFFQS